MPLLQQDMSKVSGFGDAVPEGWYHVRVKSVEVGENENTKAADKRAVNLQLAVQEPEEHVGRVIFDNPGLDPQYIGKLKNYYKAANYNPGPEGHDPEKLLDCEFWVRVKHNQSGDQTYANVVPSGIRSLQQGPGGK